MALLHPQLRATLRARAVHLCDHRPHDGPDTLIVDGDTGKPHAVRTKADERFAASTDLNEVGHALVLYVSSVILAVTLPAIVLDLSWSDVLAWLEMLGDALAFAPLGVGR